MKRLFLSFLLGICLSTFAADVPPPAPLMAEHWTLSLDGAGTTSTRHGNPTVFGANIGLGRTSHLLLPFEAGVRQSVGYGNSSTLLSTTAYGDWTLFKVDRFDFFAGANVGAAYGNIPLVWTAGPEGGVRFWIKPDVGIEARISYDWDLNTGKSRDALVYGVGFKVKL